MAADLHLSTIDGEKLLSEIVDKINSVNPDIILFGGDIVDDKAVILKDRGIGESFKRLNAKYGIYSITGNHEFINNVEPSVEFMKEYGMKVLRDSYELVDSSSKTVFLYGCMIEWLHAKIRTTRRILYYQMQSVERL